MCMCPWLTSCSCPDSAVAVCQWQNNILTKSLSVMSPLLKVMAHWIEQAPWHILLTHRSQLGSGCIPRECLIHWHSSFNLDDLPWALSTELRGERSDMQHSLSVCRAKDTLLFDTFHFLYFYSLTFNRAVIIKLSLQNDDPGVCISKIKSTSK